MFAVPDKHWKVFRNLSPSQFALVILGLARAVDMRYFPNAPTRPRKKPPERLDQPASSQVSTARILALRRGQ